MIILGDIGNTETKICLVNNNDKIVKKIVIPSKGKKLFLPNDRKTRPLKDLVKESIFNLIQHSNKINLKIENSIVLDLFAGIGLLGLNVCLVVQRKLSFLKIILKSQDLVR